LGGALIALPYCAIAIVWALTSLNEDLPAGGAQIVIRTLFLAIAAFPLTLLGCLLLMWSKLPRAELFWMSLLVTVVGTPVACIFAALVGAGAR
jgi:hypothetical protein